MGGIRLRKALGGPLRGPPFSWTASIDYP